MSESSLGQRLEQTRTTGSASPGWYPNPDGSGTRWWDGNAWSHAAADPQSATAPAVDDADIDAYLDYLETVRGRAIERLRVGAWMVAAVAGLVAVGGLWATASDLGRERYLPAYVLASASLVAASMLALGAWWALAYVADREVVLPTGE